MPKVKNLSEVEEWTEEYLINVLGVNPIEAEFIIAVHNKEILGDISENKRPNNALSRIKALRNHDARTPD